MSIHVNGVEREDRAPLPLDRLIAAVVRDDPPPATDRTPPLPTSRLRGVAVALNGSVVPRDGWDSTVVNDGDAVEVLTAMQGG